MTSIITFEGWADAGEAIEVDFDGHTLSTTASAEGSWYVLLPATGLGEAKILTVKGKNSVTVNDILMGDVWVCSGQSNMQWTVSRSKDPEEEIANANYPEIRYFGVPRETALNPRSGMGGSWVLTSPENAGNFSAVAYYFGRTLHKKLDVPIGLIGTSWGGTVIEAWTSRDAVKYSTAFEGLYRTSHPDEDIEAIKRGEVPHTTKIVGRVPNSSTLLYNAMIAPLWRYGIKGAIWYQGESNASRAYQYRDLMQTMITDWRNQFGQGDFPFFIVQLANFRARDAEPVESAWAELREAQSLAAAEMKNVGIATIIDIGEAKDIHPKNKQTVGYRLAQSALNIAYGQKKGFACGADV